MNKVNDERYGQNFVAYRARRGHGPARIRNHLQKSGLTRAAIDDAVKGEEAPDFLALARATRARKFGPDIPKDRKERAKQARFLQYRGFSNGSYPRCSGGRPRVDVDGRRTGSLVSRTLSPDAQETAFHERGGCPSCLSRILPRAWPHRGRVLQPRPGQRPDAAVHQCRHGAVQGLLPRPRQARLRARRLQPALRARRRQTQRPRERRLHRPAPHLLRDAGQLLLRRLLQEGRDPLRVGLRHRHAQDRPGAPHGHGVPDRRRGLRSVAQDDRPAGREDRAHRRQARRRLGQLLADG